MAPTADKLLNGEAPQKGDVLVLSPKGARDLSRSTTLHAPGEEWVCHVSSDEKANKDMLDRGNISLHPVEKRRDGVTNMCVRRDEDLFSELIRIEGAMPTKGQERK